MADHTDASARPQLGRLVPPYPVERCASSNCRRQLLDDMAVFLFNNLETGKLAVFCEDCSMSVELHHRDRLMLVAL